MEAIPMVGPVPAGALLAPHLAWSEAITTQVRDPEILAAQANPPPQIRANLLRLAVDLFEPARALVGRLRVSSGYRSPRLNALIGGSTTSAHMQGLALDLWPMDMPLHDAMVRLATSALPIDQIIFEAPSQHSMWIHLGAALHAHAPRGDRLMMLSPGHYEIWAPNDPRVRALSAVA